MQVNHYTSKYVIMQVCKNTRMQVCKIASMQVDNFENVWEETSLFCHKPLLYVSYGQILNFA